MSKTKKLPISKPIAAVPRSSIAENSSLEYEIIPERVSDLVHPSRSFPTVPSSVYPLARPLTILMVIDQLNIGGTETYTLSLTREMIRQGAKVVIAGKKGKLLDPFIGLGCAVYELDFVTNNFEPNTEHYPELLSLLTCIIQNEQIQLVHAHQFPSGKLAKMAADEAQLPFVFTVHGTYYDSKLLEEIRESTVISVSPAIERVLLNNGISSHLIPNGIDITEYQSYHPEYREHLRRKLGISEHALVVMYAGRLAWEKADICKELIHASAFLRKNRYPQLHVIIVGGGREEEEIVALANQKQMIQGQPFISFAGESVNMRNYYAVSDCVIGTGRVALEAMSSMRPFIAVGSKGFLGAIQFANSSKAWDSWFGDHGTTPELLTREMLIDQMDCILSMSKEDRANLSKWGRNHVSERYPITAVAKKMMETYEQALFTMK